MWGSEGDTAVPTERLARLREEIQVIDQERYRVSTQLMSITGTLDIARTEMFTAFSALRRVACFDADGQRQTVRRDDAKHLRDAYTATKQEWGAVMQQERELRARLAELDTARTDRVQEHRRVYQDIAVGVQQPRESA